MRGGIVILALTVGLTVQWPLDLRHHYLTSNFMEYRDGRFHAGIDLKTNSRPGYPCRAVEAGWVSRLRAGAWGYGQAVYLRGDSGRTYVYGHVQRLADPLRERVKAAQTRANRYAVDIELDPGELPVAQGQVLALSGESGTGGPHLHFEVRDEAGQALDPLAVGFAVRDSLAPGILKIRAVPAAPDAEIQGATVARVVAVSPAIPQLAVRGPVAFSAEVVETTDVMGHKLAPWRLALSLDGVEVFCARNDTLDLENAGQLRLEYLEAGGARERWLHRRLQNVVPGRRGGLWYEGLAPGRHELQLVAEDRAGNLARARWTLVVLDAGQPWPAAATAWRPGPVGETLTGNRIELRPGQTPGVLAPVDLWWREVPRPPLDPRSGLVTAGPTAEYLAAEWPVTGTVEVPLPPGAVDPRAAIYRLGGRTWSRVGPVQDGRFALARPGLHAVLADTLPPVIVAPAAPVMAARGPARVAAEVSPPRWARITVPVGDHGAGVDWDRLRAWLDGQPLIVEPDAPRQRVFIELPDDIAAGGHSVDLVAVDAAGNQRARVVAVVVPGGR